MAFSWRWLVPLPNNVSTYGNKIDGLFWMIFYVTGFFFIITEIALLWFVFRYKAKENKKSFFTHGNRLVEIIWTVIPGIILFLMAVYSAGPWAAIKKDMPNEKEAVVIEVMARQFAWFFRYPGEDKKFGGTVLSLVTGGDPFGRKEDDPNGKDDFVTMNEFFVPVGKKVLLKLQTRDIIHSFFVPNLRVKQDAVPGMVIPVWFEATKTGQYEIACAELCGVGHTMMRGMLTVQSQEEFNEWLNQQIARDEKYHENKNSGNIKHYDNHDDHYAHNLQKTK